MSTQGFYVRAPAPPPPQSSLASLASQLESTQTDDRWRLVAAAAGVMKEATPPRGPNLSIKQWIESWPSFCILSHFLPHSRTSYIASSDFQNKYFIVRQGKRLCQNIKATLPAGCSKGCSCPPPPRSNAIQCNNPAMKFITFSYC